MKIYMQAIGFSTGESLEAYCTEKLEKLDTFYDQIIAANVTFKLDNNNSKEDKIVDIILEIPGDDIMVTKQGEAFPEVVDIATDTLKRLIIKRKEKMSQN